MRILIADDDSVPRAILRSQLIKWGYEVVEARDGNEAWFILSGNDPPRLALLDWMMPGIDGIELCRRLRQYSNNPYFYLILLTVKVQREDLVAGLKAGADDYITKPFEPEELEMRLRTGCRILDLQASLQEALEVQRFQAQHDPLTSVLNHGAIIEVLNKELSRAIRHGSSLALLMADLDRFKLVNDIYGHLAGDTVLIEVASRMSLAIRSYDSIGRYGGEEFLAILPQCEIAEALQVATRILHIIADKPAGSLAVPVTVSLGLAVYHPGQTMDTIKLLKAADTAMYQAKANGRNRVEVAP